MGKKLSKSLTPEQIKKEKACQEDDELLALAQQEGVELSAEKLAAVSGGACSFSEGCPNCGSHNIEVDRYGDKSWCTCKNCGYTYSS